MSIQLYLSFRVSTLEIQTQLRQCLTRPLNIRGGFRKEVHLEETLKKK